MCLNTWDEIFRGTTQVPAILIARPRNFCNESKQQTLILRNVLLRLKLLNPQVFPLSSSGGKFKSLSELKEAYSR